MQNNTPENQKFFDSLSKKYLKKTIYFIYENNLCLYFLYKNQLSDMICVQNTISIPDVKHNTILITDAFIYDGTEELENLPSTKEIIEGNLSIYQNNEKILNLVDENNIPFTNVYSNGYLKSIIDEMKIKFA
jgi:hypothetical protein